MIFYDFYRFSLVFIDFHWFLYIVMDFCWVFLKFLKFWYFCWFFLKILRFSYFWHFENFEISNVSTNKKNSIEKILLGEISNLKKNWGLLHIQTFIFVFSTFWVFQLRFLIFRDIFLWRRRRTTITSYFFNI